MDRNKEKRLRNIRVAITNIFMSLCVVVIVFVLVLIAMGFTIDESGKLVQSGLIQLSSHPNDASVAIDNKTKFGHTNFSKSITSGVHNISITKDGYDTWERDVKIDAGLLTRVEWIRLFPNNPEIKDMNTYTNIRFAAFAANRKFLLVATSGSNTLQKIDIQSDNNLHIDELRLNDCLSTTSEEATHGTLSVVAWSEDSNRFVAKWMNGDKTSWHLIDVNHTEKSINLTKKYSLDFSEIHIANDSASKLWGIENGNLRLIEVNNQTVSGAVANHVVTAANNRDVVAFVRSDGSADNTLDIYRDGENGYTEITKFSSVSDTTYALGMGSFWNEQWLAYSINNKYVILSGKYPAYDKGDNSSLHAIIDQNLDYKPQNIVTNRNSRIILAGGENHFTSFDVETKELTDTPLAVTPTLAWIDDYLIWQNISDKIVIRDWDGKNRRTIVGNAAATLPVTISENNRWLLFFTEVTDSEQSNIILKREKLF